MASREAMARRRCGRFRATVAAVLAALCIVNNCGLVSADEAEITPGGDIAGDATAGDDELLEVAELALDDALAAANYVEGDAERETEATDTLWNLAAMLVSDGDGDGDGEGADRRAALAAVALRRLLELMPLDGAALALLADIHAGAAERLRPSGTVEADGSWVPRYPHGPWRTLGDDGNALLRFADRLELLAEAEPPPRGINDFDDVAEAIGIALVLSDGVPFDTPATNDVYSLAERVHSHRRVARALQRVALRVQRQTFGGPDKDETAEDYCHAVLDSSADKIKGLADDDVDALCGLANVDWQERVDERAVDGFAADGYAVLDSTVPKESLAALQRHLNALEDGDLWRSDGAGVYATAQRQAGDRFGDASTACGALHAAVAEAVNHVAPAGSPDPHRRAPPRRWLPTQCSSVGYVGDGARLGGHFASVTNPLTLLLPVSWECEDGASLREGYPLYLVDSDGERPQRLPRTSRMLSLTRNDPALGRACGARVGRSDA